MSFHTIIYRETNKALNIRTCLLRQRQNQIEGTGRCRSNNVKPTNQQPLTDNSSIQFQNVNWCG